MKRTFIAGALGALGAYFFDPQMGRTRRAKLQDQLGGLLRSQAGEARRKGEYARGHIEGLRHALTPDSPPPSDEALTAKVESETFSRWNYPKGSININTVEGVVELRGTCETPEQINRLEQEVRKITGVIDVRNYLHLPGTPAPNKQESLDAGK